MLFRLQVDSTSPDFPFFCPRNASTGSDFPFFRPRVDSTKLG
ncbi:hypothetical protein [Lactobacillus equicursoris]